MYVSCRPHLEPHDTQFHLLQFFHCARGASRRRIRRRHRSLPRGWATGVSVRSSQWASHKRTHLRPAAFRPPKSPSAIFPALQRATNRKFTQTGNGKDRKSRESSANAASRSRPSRPFRVCNRLSPIRADSGPSTHVTLSHIGCHKHCIKYTHLTAQVVRSTEL